MSQVIWENPVLNTHLSDSSTQETGYTHGSVVWETWIQDSLMPHPSLVSHLPHHSPFEECTHRVTCIFCLHSAVLSLPDSDNQSQEQAIESIPPLYRHCQDLALTARRQPCHRAQPQVRIRRPVACCFGSFTTSPASQTVPSVTPSPLVGCDC